MNVIASVLAGQGVARLVEVFGGDPTLVSISAALSCFVICIGLYSWRERK